jgi:hypothetical protein
MPSRRFAPNDYENFAKAMALDPQHADLIPEKFVMEPKSELFVWEDEKGPVFYYRISRELRVDIQFDPGVDTSRTRDGLKSGLAWLEDQIRPYFRAIVFDSVYKPLMAFAKRRLKFQDSPDLRKPI